MVDNLDGALQLLDRLCRMLDSFAGRDKAIRATYFSLLLYTNRMSDLQKADQLATFARQLSRTRLVCRMFSYPSLLLAILRIVKDWHKSTNHLETAFGASTVILYLLCGLVELVGWMAESGLILRPTDAAKWFQRSLRLWILALFIGLVGQCRRMYVRIQRDLRLPLPQWTKAHLSWHRDQLIGLVGTGADFVAAVNSLPAGSRGAKLNGAKSAGLFLVASIVGIYRIW